jgi:uncharacterized membrane protein
VSRRGYLDWLRGVAVLIMIEAHLFDAWVRVPDRSEVPYRWAIAIGGYSAPLFLFLADAARIARRRGWQIFGLAILFRLQSFVISGGPFPQTILKVDILNVMGLSIVLAAVLWSLASNTPWRAAALGAGALFFAFSTPVIRETSIVGSLPYPLEWYVRSVPGSGAFTLFPWVGFLLCGVVIGLCLDRARTEDEERGALRWMVIFGPVLALSGYLATFLPTLYTGTTFWTGSPTFFFVRLGVLISAIPSAYLWNAFFRGWSPLRDFGKASLFVYWVHVEMVYGIASFWLHKTLTFEQAAVSYVAFSLFLFWLVKVKDRVDRDPAPPHPRTLATSPGT